MHCGSREPELPGVSQPRRVKRAPRGRRLPLPAPGLQDTCNDAVSLAGLLCQLQETKHSSWHLEWRDQLRGLRACQYPRWAATLQSGTGGTW